MIMDGFFQARDAGDFSTSKFPDANDSVVIQCGELEVWAVLDGATYQRKRNTEFAWAFGRSSCIITLMDHFLHSS